jgi:hypothetical protein
MDRNEGLDVIQSVLRFHLYLDLQKQMMQHFTLAADRNGQWIMSERSVTRRSCYIWREDGERHCIYALSGLDGSSRLKLE